MGRPWAYLHWSVVCSQVMGAPLTPKPHWNPEALNPKTEKHNACVQGKAGQCRAVQG